MFQSLQVSTKAQEISHHNIQYKYNQHFIQAMIKTRNEKNQSYLLTVHKNKVMSKKLSNIEEDEEISSEIRMPFIPKKKDSHKSEIQFGNKLNKILNLSEKRNKSSSSVQSHHSSFLNEYKYSKPNIRSENLPQLKPLFEPKRNKSSLDKILADRNDFVKAYFEDLARTERMRKNHPEEEGVQFEFPEIRVGSWKVRGYLKQNHILLKGTHKDSRICIKKYDYQKIYEKIRKDYQTWVESKFSFQN